MRSKQYDEFSVILQQYGALSRRLTLDAGASATCPRPGSTDSDSASCRQAPSSSALCTLRSRGPKPPPPPSQGPDSGEAAPAPPWKGVMSPAPAPAIGGFWPPSDVVGSGAAAEGSGLGARMPVTVGWAAGGWAMDLQLQEAGSHTVSKRDTMCSAPCTTTTPDSMTRAS